MTTGRINQVTTIRSRRPSAALNARVLAPSQELSPSWSSSFSTSKRPGHQNKSRPSTPGGVQAGRAINNLRRQLASFSQVSSTLLPVLRGTKIMAFGEDYQQPTKPERLAQ